MSMLLPPAAAADPVMAAAVQLLRDTGAADMHVRLDSQQEPETFIAAMRHRVGPDGVPSPLGMQDRWRVAGGLSPLEAVMHLCVQAVDEGTCRVCRQRTFLNVSGELMLIAERCEWVLFADMTFGPLHGVPGSSGPVEGDDVVVVDEGTVDGAVGAPGELDVSGGVELVDERVGLGGAVGQGAADGAPVLGGGHAHEAMGGRCGR